MNDKTDEIDKLTTDRLLNELTKATDSFHTALVVNIDRKSMPEGMFKEYFLPYLSGKEPMNDNKDIIAEWIAIAGSPFAEVSITDNTGDELFIVPALFDTRGIKVVPADNEVSFNRIFSNYDMQMTNLPRLADNYLNNELARKNSEVNGSTDVESNILEWSTILKKYGYDTLESPSSVNAEDDVADDLEYD